MNHENIERVKNAELTVLLRTLLFQTSNNTNQIPFLPFRLIYAMLKGVDLGRR